MKRILSMAAAVMLLCAGGAQAETLQRYTSDFSSVAELKEAGLAKARQVEAEGIVLLKNDNGVLPLGEGAAVSLVGVTAIDPVYGGTGSGAVDANGAPTYVDVMDACGLTLVDRPLMDYYLAEKADQNIGRTSHGINEEKWRKVTRNHDDTLGQGENAIVVIGRVGGEGNDVGTGIEDTFEEGGDYLRLNENELAMLEGLKEMKDTGSLASIILVINSANPISAAFINDEAYGIDAALWVGSVGQTGLYAVGDVLTGAVAPSGALPDTWWQDNMLDPVMNNFGAEVYADADVFFPGGSFFTYTRYVVYQEGIYMGYRYTETRYEDALEADDFDYDSVVAYPFGYGLSYTTFDVSDMTVERVEDGNHSTYEATLTVTNTGDTAGRKAVQIYIRKPYTDHDRENGIEKAAVELGGFTKTALLAPGESETVTVSVPEYFLTSFDAEVSEAFILDEGTYGILYAENAHDAVVRACGAEGEPEAGELTVSGNDPLVWLLGMDFDDETYADSYGTGEMVSSLFSFADMNRYDGAEDNEITWYSRSDWEGTLTEGPVQLTMTDLMAMDMQLDDGDLEDDGSDFPVMGADNGLQLIDLYDLEADDPLWDDFMDQLTFEELELLCCTGLRETAIVERIGKPYTVDHNGPTGVTQHYDLVQGNGLANAAADPDASLPGTCYPCNGILAATFDQQLIEEVGAMVGEDAMWAGYAGIYGTGLNLHRSPYAGRVFEYFSEDPVLTGLMGAAWSRGVQSKGVYVYNKHMALNDQEENRAGLGTWCTEQAIRELYLRAFELPIVYADAKCVMSAFNRLGPVWCGASYALMTEWLRGEVGLTGFTVTDMYDYSYMVGAHEILAGSDLPDGELLRNGYTLAPYAEDGETPNAALVNAMRTSARRILYTVLHSRGMDGMTIGE